MDVEIVVAYVAAAVSLIGLIVNIIISGTNRYLDDQEKRKNIKVRSIEEYYSPLNSKVEELAYLINQYELLVGHSCTTNDLMNDLIDSENKVPAKAFGLFEIIKEQISELNTFFKENKYQFYPDYHIKRLHDFIQCTVFALTVCLNQDECNHCNNITQNFLQCLDLFSKRFQKITVRLYTNNLFYWIFPNNFINKNNL